MTWKLGGSTKNSFSFIKILDRIKLIKEKTGYKLGLSCAKLRSSLVEIG
jgi:hypothetical protein